MEKDAAGYPSLPLHYGLMNPGTSRTSPAAYPTSSPVLRGGGGGDAASLPDREGYSGPQKVDHSGHLHLLRLFPSQPPVNPGPMDLARGSVIE